VASIYSNGSISVRLGDGSAFTALKTVYFSATGGWQTWASQVVKIDLPKGDYVLRLVSLSSEYNINWFDITLPTGLDEVPGLKHFRVYPNPSDGIFFVEAEFTAMTPVMITMYDLMGNQMINYSIENTESLSKRFEYPGSQPGIYFLILSTVTGRTTSKIIVN